MRLLWSFFLAICLSLPANAQEKPIQDTIQSQFDAFLKDDFAAAFEFASPMIKGIFGTPERFGQMVTQGYPMVHRPSAVEMLELRELEGRLWQRVLVTDLAGRGHVLEYQMIETPDGWRINGVELLKSDGLGV
ncbi:MAG: DUF4864 domain-containing protein [Tabrizicola sp.]